MSALEQRRRDFATPPVERRPIARWWWPGGDVVDDEIRREVDLLAGAGFGGIEIQALRMGLPVDLDPSRDARVHSASSTAVAAATLKLFAPWGRPAALRQMSSRRLKRWTANR